jgi:hypothetical protein
MPDAYVLAPNDRHAVDTTVGKPGLGGRDTRGEPRMPAGKQRRAGLRGLGFERVDLCKCRARRLFEEYVQALVERHRGERITHLRRRAERNRVDRGTVGEQRLQRPEVGDTLDARIPRADAGDKVEFGVACDRG